MKRLCALLLLLALLPCAALAQSGVKMNIKVTAVCADYNHVGKNWSFIHLIDGEPIGKRAVELQPDTAFVLFSEITEDDKYPDVGSAKVELTPTADELAHGFSAQQTIIVTENRGRYSGCSAEWTVTYTFKPE